MAIVSAGASLGGFAGGSVLSRLLVVISGQTTPLSSALRTAQSDVLTFSQKANAMGNAVTRSISLPALAAAGSMVFLNAQFSKSIATIAGLTPVVESGEESVESLTTKILDLARGLPTAPNEIARSYYFAASAGLTAAQAFDVVELSSKAAAIGMGEASDISRVLISALNAYESEGLTAAAAMDALTAAIREGTAEPDEMAIALGRVLPIAQQAGIAFDEVVASVAALTNIGVPTRVATTSLRALFSQLLAPTIQATELLNELGLTAGDVRSALAQGPIVAFKLLEEATKGNVDQLHDLIPQIRGITAYFGLGRDRLDDYRRALDETRNSVGDFDRAFSRISDQPAFRFEVALNQLRVAAIELGGKMIPIFEKIVSAITMTAEALADLPEWAKGALAGMLLLAGAAGPLIKLVAAMSQVKEISRGVGQTMAYTVPTAKAMGTQLLTLGISAVIAWGSLNQLANGAKDLTTIGIGVVSSIIGFASALKVLQSAAQIAASRGIGGLVGAFAGLSGTWITGIAVGLGLVATGIAYLAGEADRARAQVTQMGEALLGAAQQGETMRAALDKIESEDLRALVQSIAEVRGLLGQPVSTALPAVLEGLNSKIALTSRELSSIDLGGIIGADERFQSLARAVSGAASAGEDWGDALRALPGGEENVGQFLEDLDRIAKESPDRAIRDMADALSDELLPAFEETNGVISDYQQAQTDMLAMQALETDEVERMADQYGVSFDFMKNKLAEFGVSATGLYGDGRRQFEQLAFGVKRSGETIEGSVAEMAAATDEAAKQMSEALMGTFTMFGELPKMATKAMGTILERSQKLADIWAEQGQNVGVLAERGVPTDLIERLIGEGPAMVRKFAEASDKELNRLVSAYTVSMVAMDQEILRESAHQQVKGKRMVEGFARAILSMERLPKDAARQLAFSIGLQLQSGKYDQQGMMLVEQFARGIDAQKNIPADEMADVIRYLAGTVGQGQFMTKKGNLMVGQLVQGIIEKTGITKKAARQLVNSIEDGIEAKQVRDEALRLSRTVADMIRTGKPNAERAGGELVHSTVIGMNARRPEIRAAGLSAAGAAIDGMTLPEDSFAAIGRSMGNALASGITSTAAAVREAAAAVAREANKGMETGAHNSPEYYSYYLGQRVMEDLGRGMKQRERQIGVRTLQVSAVGAGTSDRPKPTGDNRQEPKLELNVRMDRMKAAKDLEWGQRARGY